MIRIVSYPKFGNLGQVGFEPTANRLKAEYSTTELLTRCLLYSHHKVFLQIVQIWI